MRIAKLYPLVAPIIALALASTACQTAQRSAALLPAAQANAPALTAAAAPVPQTQTPAETKPAAVPQVQPAPKPDPVVELIAKVETEYQAGQDNYKAGHLEAAKQNFDRAFNLLLGGPFAVRSDERLQREFDRLLDGVNGLELQALQQGDGFTEQKSEPAPIDGGERPMLGFETLTLAPIDRALIEAALLTGEERAQVDGYHARVRATVGPKVTPEVGAWLEGACAPL